LIQVRAVGGRRARSLLVTPATGDRQPAVEWREAGWWQGMARRSAGVDSAVAAAGAVAGAIAGAVAGAAEADAEQRLAARKDIS
jgi:hypothetical protein